MSAFLGWLPADTISLAVAIAVVFLLPVVWVLLLLLLLLLVPIAAFLLLLVMLVTAFPPLPTPPRVCTAAAPLTLSFLMVFCNSFFSIFTAAPPPFCFLVVVLMYSWKAALLLLGLVLTLLPGCSTFITTWRPLPLMLALLLILMGCLLCLLGGRRACEETRAGGHFAGGEEGEAPPLP